MTDTAPTSDNTAADAARADADAAAAADAATAAAADAAKADADAAAAAASAKVQADANAAVIAAAVAGATTVDEKAAAAVAAAATLDGAETNDAGDVTTLEFEDDNLKVTRVTLAAGGVRFDFLDKNSGRTSPEHPDALPAAVPANDPLAPRANDPLAAPVASDPTVA